MIPLSSDLVHTYAVSLLLSVTPGTQVLTQLLGTQSRPESWMVRCSPWPRPPGFSRSNQHNFELTLPALSLDYYQKKKKNENLDSPCVTHSLIKPET